MGKTVVFPDNEEARCRNNKRDLPRDYFYFLFFLLGFLLSVTSCGSSFAHLTPWGETGAMIFGGGMVHKAVALFLKHQGCYHYLFSGHKNEQDCYRGKRKRKTA